MNQDGELTTPGAGGAPPAEAALDAAAAPDLGVRFMDFIDLGGPVVIILLAMSVVALAIVLLKLWQFWMAGAGRTRAAERAVALHAEGRLDEAAQAAERGRSPASRVITRALDRLRRGASPAIAREDATQLGADILEDMRGYLRPLEVIVALAPLLGLFGTVLGMIDAFRALELAGSNVDPAALSGGIWVALLTTAVGLGVAMPVVAMLNLLERRIERAAHDMDNALARLFLDTGAAGNREASDDGRIRATAAGD